MEVHVKISYCMILQFTSYCSGCICWRTLLCSSSLAISGRVLNCDLPQKQSHRDRSVLNHKAIP